MPCGRDDPDDDRPAASEIGAPTLITGHWGTVGFLDAPDASAATIVEAAVAAFERLTDDATVTVYARSADVETVLVELRREHAIHVIASFLQPNGGTTLTLGRRAPSDDPASEARADGGSDGRESW